MAKDDSSPQNLYHRELNIFRESVSEDLSVIGKYYGFTLLYSLPPDEYLKMRERLGFDKTSAHDYYNFGVIHAQAEEWGDAIKLFDKALADEPDFFEARYNRAFSLEQKGDVKNAVKAWEELLASLDESNAARVEIQNHLEELKQA
jgi:tetratricopeptide (TPR) repeat protein